MNELPTELKFMILLNTGVCGLALCSTEWLRCALTLFPVWIEQLKKRLRLKLLHYAASRIDLPWIKGVQQHIAQYKRLMCITMSPVVKLSLAPGVEIAEQFELDKSQYIQLVEDRLCTDPYIVLMAMRRIGNHFISLNVARVNTLLEIKQELQPRDHRFVLRYCEPQHEHAAMKIVELGVGTPVELGYLQKYLLWHACRSRSQKFSFVPTFETFQQLPNLFNLTPKLVAAALRHPSSEFYTALVEHYGIRNVSSIASALR